MSDTPAASKMLTAPLSVSFTASERGRVRRAAFLSDQSVSAFIRAAAVKASERKLRQSDEAAKKAA